MLCGSRILARQSKARAKQQVAVCCPLPRLQHTLSKESGQGMSWRNGLVRPIAEATISATDWGLTHSDITYDVVPVWDGAFFRLDAYIERFVASMKALRLDTGMDEKAIAAALGDMVAASGLREGYTSMVASRGGPKMPGSRDPRHCNNHFYAWVVPYVHLIQPEVAEAGASAWIAKSVRRVPPECINPLIKSYHWGDMTHGLLEAKDHGAETVFLLDQQDNVTEGPGFNIFAAKNGCLVTPDSGVLHGITRRTAMDVAAELGLACTVRPLHVDELLGSDEVFITSSAGGIFPITSVDHRVFGNGAPGALTQSIKEGYWAMMKRPELRTEISYTTS